MLTAGPDNNDERFSFLGGSIERAAITARTQTVIPPYPGPGVTGVAFTCLALLMMIDYTRDCISSLQTPETHIFNLLRLRSV